MKKYSINLNNQDSKVITISHGKPDILIGKCLPKAAIFVWIFAAIWESLWRNSTSFTEITIRFPIVSFQVILPILIFAYLLFYLSTFKHAYRIDFNFKNNSVTFYMYRNSKVIIKDIDNLYLILINWHTYFLFRDGQKIWFKATKELFELFKIHNLPRKWGKIAQLLLRNEYLEDPPGRHSV